MWTVCNADGEVKFRCMRVQCWGGLRWWLKLLLLLLLALVLVLVVDGL